MAFLVLVGTFLLAFSSFIQQTETTCSTRMAHHSFLTGCISFPTAQSCYNEVSGQVFVGRSADITLGEYVEGEFTIEFQGDRVVYSVDLGTYDDIQNNYGVSVTVGQYECYTTILATGPNSMVIGSNQTFAPTFVRTQNFIPTLDHVYLLNYTDGEGVEMIVKMLVTGIEDDLNEVIHSVSIDWDVIYHEDSENFPCFQVQNGPPNVNLTTYVSSSSSNIVAVSPSYNIVDVSSDNTALIVISVLYGVALLILGVAVVHLFFSSSRPGYQKVINSGL